MKGVLGDTIGAVESFRCTKKPKPSEDLQVSPDLEFL
jgi:hypothetical protein